MDSRGKDQELIQKWLSIPLTGNSLRELAASCKVEVIKARHNLTHTPDSSAAKTRIAIFQQIVEGLKTAESVSFQSLCDNELQIPRAEEFVTVVSDHDDALATIESANPTKMQLQADNPDAWLDGVARIVAQQVLGEVYCEIAAWQSGDSEVYIAYAQRYKGQELDGKSYPISYISLFFVERQYDLQELERLLPLSGRLEQNQKIVSALFDRLADCLDGDAEKIFAEIKAAREFKKLPPVQSIAI